MIRMEWSVTASFVALVVFLTAITLWVFFSIGEVYSWDRKIRWLETHGFRRYLDRVIYDSGTFPYYGWENEGKGVKITEREIEGASFKDMVAKIEEVLNEDR